MRYYLAILTTILFFSTVEVVTKCLHDVAPAFDPNLLAFIRFFPSGVIILVLGFRGWRRASGRDVLGMVALGLIGITLTFSAYHASLAVAGFDAAPAAVIFSINPVFCVVAAAVLLGERLSWKQAIGVLLGVAGVYVVSFGFGPVPFESVRAPALMFGAQICFATYVVGARKYVATYGPFFVNGVIFVAGSLCFLPLIGRWSVPGDVVALSQLAYLSLLATGVAYILYFYGLNRVSVTSGTSFFYLKPVLASLLALQVRREPIGLVFLTGLVVILASLTLTVFGRGRASARRAGCADGEPTRR